MGRPAKCDIGIECQALSVLQVATILGKSGPTVRKWVQAEGCPRNPDGTMSVRDTVEWLLKRAAEGNADNDKKAEKTKWEVERLKAQVAKINETYIERAEHEQLLVSRANSLRTYIEKTLMGNASRLAHKSPDEIRVAFDNMVRDMMNAYAGQRSDKRRKG